jgi:chemotaxis protein methyltransferase CheR
MSNAARTLSQAPDPIEKIAQMISQLTGIQLGERQRAMVQSRLRKRMTEVQASTPEEYLEYLEENRASEIQQLVSLLTTHHTYFFREFAHFDFLLNSGLKQAIDSAKKRGDRTIKIWSAACSRGQEAYSISMFLNHHLKAMAPEMSYSILGTDVDPESVDVASNGVYPRSEIKQVPLNYLGDNWAQGTGEISEFVKAKKSIREQCRFETANLIQLPESLLKSGSFDIIFCRNVFIYFNAEQIKSITQNLLRALSPEGLLFLGISETLNGLGLPVDTKGPSIYVRKESRKDAAPGNVVPLVPRSSPVAKESVKPLRVLCIDDSSSIHSLMKQILRKEEGFEVVGSAMNGLEAAKRVKELRPDVVTLDIHMPEQDGISYLKASFGPEHPPVVMVSSVTREESELALKALSLGASDYVEKPALSNLAERGEEIRTKLRCAHMSRQNRKSASLDLDRSFGKRTTAIRAPESKLRVIVAGLGDLAKIKALLNEVDGPQPPTHILIEGATGALEGLCKKLTSETKTPVELKELVSAREKPGRVVVSDFKKGIDDVRKVYASAHASILAFGGISKHAADKLRDWKGSRIILEDIGGERKHGLLASAADLVPATSFAYLSCSHLAEEGK